MSERHRHTARLLIGRDPISANPKLNNLVKGWRAVKTEWVVFVDSNVILPRDSVARLFARVDAETGMVCSPPIGSRPDGYAAQLECAFLNTYQARWQSTADACGHGFAQGKVMLFKRSLIDQAGGLPVLAKEPAEDAAATRVVRASGLSVRLVDRFFEQPLGHRSFTSVWQRQVRWARLRRASFPLYFATEIMTGIAVPMLATFGLCLALEQPIFPAILALVTVWYGLEAALAWLAGWPSSPIYGVIRDLMLPAVWLQGWLSRDFTWQGHSMRAERHTTTSELSGA